MTENTVQPAEDLRKRLSNELPRVKGFLRGLAPRDWEDLLQDVMERALRYQDAYKGEGSLSGWLIKTAFRVYLDFQRQRQRAPLALDERALALRAPPDKIVEDRETVSRLLQYLTSDEREVLIRFHSRGESIREIARALGMRQGTVKSHLHRARKKLSSQGDRP